jgi:hypothetical protein
MADSPGLTRTNACAHTAISEALLRDIVGTQGRYLTPCPDTPVLGLAHDIYFAFQLHEALRLLTDRIKVRSTLYGYRGDDSRIGHTPPALREQYCSPEHESIRSFIKHMGASTPDSPDFSLPTPYPSQSPETPIKPVEATTKRKRESLENLSDVSPKSTATRKRQNIFSGDTASGKGTSTKICDYNTPTSDDANRDARGTREVTLSDTE